jgi:hypothetical protein
MTLSLLHPHLFVHNVERFDGIEDNCTVEIYTHMGVGPRSHKMSIQFEPKRDEGIHHSDDDPIFCWSLNKNEALYLMNFLKSFINEKDIDVDAED